MKRLVIATLLFLLVLQIVVAGLAGALYPTPSLQVVAPTDESNLRFRASRYLGVDQADVRFHELTSGANLLMDTSRVSFFVGSDADTAFVHYVIESGFPFRALRSEARATFADTTRIDVTGLRPPSWMAVEPTWRRIPLNVRAHALLGNTLLWSAPVFLVYAICIRLRTLVRTRSGKCTRCGYDIGQESGCPECGLQFQPSSTTSMDPREV